MRACRGGEIGWTEYTTVSRVLTCRGRLGARPCTLPEHDKIAVLTGSASGCRLCQQNTAPEADPLTSVPRKGFCPASSGRVQHAQALGCDLDAEDYRG